MPKKYGREQFMEDIKEGVRAARQRKKKEFVKPEDVQMMNLRKEFNKMKREVLQRFGLETAPREPAALKKVIRVAKQLMQSGGR